MDDSILIDEVGEQEEYSSVPEPYTACSSSVQPPEFEVEVEIVKPPCLGMCFETLEAAKQFYIDYGKLFGFSPVIRSSEKSYSRPDEVSSVQMTCLHFGIYRDRGSKNMNVDGTEKEEVDPGICVVNSCTVGDSSAPPLDDPSQVLLQNPNISQTKGRKKAVNIYKKTKANGRIKGGLEQACGKAKAKTERRCTCCNKVGVNHDRRNCLENPNIKKGPIVDEDEDKDEDDAKMIEIV
ncbi:hypothetical protein IFM89_017886 [Coptis chinensis]|uniref:FAR1 domain-containing protein n=1 Tax=Coptis chinensis TaxID=261450 RepID=A0A835I4W8_9MAGN|nr:hypothetical protein IFM89_017886 [Coptis chinensis]